MTQFSEESILLIENWETVEDILKAVERLETQLGTLLGSTGAQLEAQEWWSGDWRFVPRSEDQIYISNEHWAVAGSHLIWIGLERFTASRLLGTGPAPQFYVWVHRKHRELAHTLSEEIEISGEDLLGDVDHTQSGYVVKHQMHKWPPGVADGLEKHVVDQIVGFFSHWATTLSDFDQVIQEYSARARCDRARESESAD